MRIAHIADLHFRSLVRHEEYHIVFQDFFQDISKQNVDVVWIGGDIFHTKTSGISPEFIELLTWFLTELSKICEVHMMLGNHDGNLMNLSRQDAITPIVDALKNPRVFLYKKSGIYQFSPGWNWCVYSPFDVSSWDQVKPTSGDVNIACFHGPVWGATTETDWAVEGEVTADFFKDYDFALLGDIHKMQYLSCRAGKPWIGYCGSTIQQTYAEEIDHGYLLWDIRNADDFDVEFKKLVNPHPFITVEWHGTIEDISEQTYKYPKGSRVRVKSDKQISQNDIRALYTRLKNTHAADEVILKIDSTFDPAVSNNEAYERKRDLRDVSTQLKLFQKFYSSVTTSELEWEGVQEHLKSYVSQLQAADDVTRNTKWSIKRLEFDNVFAYGKNNVVNFEHMNGITGIFAPNKSGKSSLIGALMYALFNSSDRGSLKNLHVINIRKGYCIARAKIGVNGTDYLIERQTIKYDGKKAQQPYATTNLNFFRLDDHGNTFDDMNGEQRKDTDKEIKRLIGAADDFLLTSFSSQNDVMRFITEGSTGRRAILSKFLDLDIFEKLHELVKRDSAVVKLQLKSLPEIDSDAMIGALKNERAVSFERLETLRSLIEEQTSKLNEHRNEIRILGGANVVTIVDIDTLEIAVRDELLGFDEEKKKIVSLEQSIQTIEEKILQIEGVKTTIDIVALRKKRECLQAATAAAINAKHIHAAAIILLQQQLLSVKKLSDVPCGDSFPTCKYIRDSHEDKKRLEAQYVVVDQLTLELDKFQASVAQLRENDIESSITKYEAILQKENQLKSELAKKTVDRSLSIDGLSEREKKITDLRTKIEDFKKRLDVDVSTKLLTSKQEASKIEYMLKAADEERMGIAQRVGAIGNEIKKLEAERDHVVELKRKWRVYELLLDATHKNGIPAQILCSELPMINAEIASILHSVVNFTVELEMDSETNALEVYLNYGDSRRVIELGCGMEKMISSLAIRVALLTVSSLPKTDMLIIDEGFGSLDDTNVEACNRFLVSLKKQFKNIVVISHIDGIKDVVDNLIEIVYEGRDSIVRYE